MKIVETNRRGDYGEDCHIEISLTTDTYEGSVSFGEGEPEDMTLGRDLCDAYSISSLLMEAYEAGRRGETYSYESGEEED